MSISEFLRLYAAALTGASLSFAVVFFYYRCPFFRRLDRKGSLLGGVYSALLFGALSAFLSFASAGVHGAETAFGAVSVSIGCVISAGLIAGPIAGVGAGILGGAYRYFFGTPFDRVAAVLAIFIAGVLGATLWYFIQKRPPRPSLGMASGAVASLLYGGFVLLFSEPFSDAASYLSVAAAPVILGNALCAFLCLYAYRLNLTRGYLHETV